MVARWCAAFALSFLTGVKNYSINVGVIAAAQSALDGVTTFKQGCAGKA